MDIIKQIIQKTQYSGTEEKEVKEISASSLGSELLQVWLRYKHGVMENTEFNQATLGSLAHIGIQELLKDEYEIEKSLKCKMYRGWSLTGSIDLMNDKEIIDIKVTKKYTYESVVKDPYHQYARQLSAYKYLAKKVLDKDLDIYLLMILKDGGYNFKKGGEDPHIIKVPIQYLGDDWIENEFIDIVKAIEDYESVGSEPSQCSDLWFRKVKGQAIPTKCKMYCSYNKVCPYYSENNSMSAFTF